MGCSKGGKGDVYPIRGMGKVSYTAMSRAEIEVVEAMRLRNQKGGGKGMGGKGNGGTNGAKGAQATFICKWADCKAGCNQTPTYGQSLCISCKRYKGLALAPPLHKMSERAFNLAVGRSNAGPKKDEKGKGKGKGKAYEKHLQNSPDLTDTERALKASRAAQLKSADRKVPPEGVGGQSAPAASEDADMEVEEDTTKTLAESLLTMDLYPAPLVADLRLYARPAVRGKPQDSVSESTDQISKLESGLQEARSNGHADGIIKAFSHELAALKGAQPKAAKPAQSKGVLLTQLQRRLEMSDKLTQNALDRHKGHLEALDAQIAQLKAIREFKVKDFSEAKKAFSDRLVQDRQAIADLREELGSLVGECPDKKAQEVNEGVQSALEDLVRHCDVDSSELPTCPDVEETSEKKALESLWHLYAQVSFGEVPALTFDALQLSPSFAHTLVGDQVWNGFWTTKATSVTGGQFIPESLHNYLKYVVQANGERTIQAAAKETAQQRINAARSLAAERKMAGEPY